MRAVIFDFDGVLVDSEPLHFRALRDALVPEGFRIDEEEYAGAYLAYDDREAIRIALERHGIPYDGERVDSVSRRKAALFESLRAGVPVFPGVRELIAALRAEVPLAIASGALRNEIEAILRAAGLREAFDAIVGADDVGRCKPDPEPYLTALARLGALAPGLQPGDCLVFEDSVAGVASGLAAGMKVVAVTHSYPAARLQGAHRVIDTLEGLAPSELRGLFESA